LRRGLHRPSRGLEWHQPTLAPCRKRQFNRGILDEARSSTINNRHSLPYIGTLYREKKLVGLGDLCDHTKPKSFRWLGSSRNIEFNEEIKSKANDSNPQNIR